MGFIAQIIDTVKVVDLSADFRLRDVSVYQEWYQEHSNPELLNKTVYGLCEIYCEEIRTAQTRGEPRLLHKRTASPHTAFEDRHHIFSKDIIVDSKSGVSGAGRGLSLKTHICETGESFSAYKVGRSHRHIPR